jgi:uncharacterized protein YcgL (UPF0745 family)
MKEYNITSTQNKKCIETLACAADAAINHINIHKQQYYICNIVKTTEKLIKQHKELKSQNKP